MRLSAKDMRVLQQSLSNDLRTKLHNVVSAGNPIDYSDIMREIMDYAAQNHRYPQAQLLAQSWLADEEHRRIRRNDPRSPGRVGGCFAVGGTVFLVGAMQVPSCLHNGCHWSLVLMPIGAIVVWVGFKIWG